MHTEQIGERSREREREMVNAVSANVLTINLMAHKECHYCVHNGITILLAFLTGKRIRIKRTEQRAKKQFIILVKQFSNSNYS